MQCLVKEGLKKKLNHI